MEARTGLINCAGAGETLGERLKQCDAEQVEEALSKPLSAAAQAVIGPLLAGAEPMAARLAPDNVRRMH